MNAEEFFEWDQHLINSEGCSTYGIRQYDYSDPEDVAYSEDEMVAFAEAYYRHRISQEGENDNEI